MDVTGLRQRKKGRKVVQNVAKDDKDFAGKGCCLRVFQISGFVVCVGLLYLFYAYATSPVSSVAVEDFPNLHELDWPFQPNVDLQNGKKLYMDLVGPESVAYDQDGNLYSGLKDGRVMKFEQGQTVDSSGKPESVTDLTKLLNYSPDGERKQMRPLGLRYQDDKLYIADAYQGVLLFDLKTKKYETLVGYNDITPPMMFTDDLVISGNGKIIYFTDASSRWNYAKMAFSAIEGECSGRLFKIDMTMKTVQTLMDGLCFANGVQLSEDENTLLLSETGRCRIQVIDLKSLQIVKTIVLPGGPDNIRSSADGGYWVAIPMLHDMTADIFRGFPLVRTVLAGVLSEKSLLAFGNFKRGVAVKLNKDGDVVRVLYDLDGKLSRAVTQVSELGNGELVLGSFIEKGIVKISSVKK